MGCVGAGKYVRHVEQSVIETRIRDMTSRFTMISVLTVLLMEPLLVLICLPPLPAFVALVLYFLFMYRRNCSDRVVMLEASVETYKRKLENLGDLKRQMKLLEENNMTYMQNTVSLEEELRKANAARAQLETYKRQVSDMQSRTRFDFIHLRYRLY